MTGATNKKAPNGPDGKTKRRSLEDLGYSELVDKLDQEFSFWVRSRYCNDDGTAVRCYCCGKYYPIGQIDAGHYISRRYYGLRWDPMNVKPQCRSENRFQNGNPLVFRQRLVEEYGAKEVETMEQFAQVYGTVRPPREWLIEQIRKYRYLNGLFRKRKGGLIR